MFLIELDLNDDTLRAHIIFKIIFVYILKQSLIGAYEENNFILKLISQNYIRWFIFILMKFSFHISSK